MVARSASSAGLGRMKRFDEDCSADEPIAADGDGEAVADSKLHNRWRVGGEDVWLCWNSWNS
jgi:hypothetical protein